jgi:hypothetical protein
VSFPSPGLTPPTLEIFQCWYKGLTFCGLDQSIAYQVISIDGLDGIPTVNADIQRPLDTGMFAGLDVGSERNITITQVIKGATGADLATARQALGGVLSPAGAIESPFYIQMENGIYSCMARPEKYNFTLDLNMVQVLGGTSTCLMRATDPRLYGAPSKTATVGLPAPSGGGMTFPATFNLSFGGGGGAGGILDVYNNGTFEMRPIVIFTGPCTNPVATNLTLASAPSVGFDIVLNTGDTLTVDMQNQSAVLLTAGSSQGVSRLADLVFDSVWWNLIPGLNVIEFTTSDGVQVAGTMTVESADAYAGI